MQQIFSNIRQALGDAKKKSFLRAQVTSVLMATGANSFTLAC